MNFTITGRREPRKVKLVGEELNITHAEGEDPDLEPKRSLVNAARSAAADLAAELGAPCAVEINGHVGSSTEEDDFHTGHVTVTVSRLHPEAG